MKPVSLWSWNACQADNVDQNPERTTNSPTLKEITSQTDLYLVYLQKRMFLKTKLLGISQFDYLFHVFEDKLTKY